MRIRDWSSDVCSSDLKRWPLPVHRLDRDTSGCLLLARNPKAHGRFTRAFEGREIEKRYLAILDGIPDGDAGTIDLPLAKVSTAETGWRMIGDPKGKPSVSHWEKLAVIGKIGRKSGRERGCQ